ncbi:MAG: glycosyltransferase family 39 protein [Phycisphaerae bacterium]|jgi:4-amino-4-deoxy-L-arabinose transferase-like glycosyltransferase|nr:glycosyltransferase family 39 protein [Phycisphaerae bacterium]HOO18040.1 glycosyltransferase family 39 protein [Phycisphaerae bacterium]HPC21540.1 glycosyltransferase family 39 protein [Phycisphaerae bacterium]HRS26906.1 glycosyltransferase family 39 protein [Phycisphaerae bacterium]HRT42054.1 glycosyltransferase family 39 protein [Phycisphaerae bacterium]
MNETTATGMAVVQDTIHDPYKPSPWPVLLLAMALFIVPLIVLSQFIAYWRTDVVDDQMFGYFGWRIAHGATVYLDVWDNKPPGIYWINALGMLLGRDSYLGVIGMCSLALLVSFACFFGICASLYYRGAAAFSTALLGFYLTHGYFTGGTNRTETFLVACELAAVLLYIRGFARDRGWKWLLAGLLCGCAFLFKQTGLAACAAMMMHLTLLAITRDITWRQWLRRGLLVGCGVGLTLAVAAGYLAWQGALGEALFATFGFNRTYFAAGASGFPYKYLTYYLLKNHLFPILLLPMLMAIAACIHAVLWRLRPYYRPREIEESLTALRPACPRYMVLFVLWFLWSVWGALLSPHAFRHYLVPTIPPLMLIASYLINMLQAEMRLLVVMQRRAWATAAVVVIAYFGFDALERQFEQFSMVWVPRFLQHKPAEWEVLGEAVKTVTGPEDKIQCLGYYPGVYLWSRRTNAVRFTTTEKVGQVRHHADFVLKELQEKLPAEPPTVIVISVSDYLKVQGPAKPDDRAPTMLLGPWIDENYERLADVPGPNTYIFKRKDLVQPSDRELQKKVWQMTEHGIAAAFDAPVPAPRIVGA